MAEKIDVIQKNNSEQHLLFKPLHPHIITLLTRYLNTTKGSDYRSKSAAKIGKKRKAKGSQPVEVKILNLNSGDLSKGKRAGQEIDPDEIRAD